MKKILLAAAVFCAVPLFAQTYTFSHFIGGYTDLSGSTSLNNGMTWDDPEYQVPIGFDFQLYGEVIDSLQIAGLGGLLVTGPCDPGDKESVLALFAVDIIDRGDNTGNSMSNISYVVEGVPGNRVFKLEWNNAGFFSGDVDASMMYIDYVNFQVWLYEGTNVIEYRYGPNSVTNPTADYEGASGPGVGLFGNYNCDTDVLESESYALEMNPLSPSVFNLTDLDSAFFLNGTILSGQVYRFAPVAGPVSIVEIDLANEVTIYPNPGNDLLTIESGELIEEVYVARLIDLSGSLAQDNLELNTPNVVSNVNSGAYFVELELGDGRKIRKKWLKR